MTEACAVVDIEGRASDRLYAMGPVTAGVFWEIVAIPDIRVQAAQLAGALAAASGSLSEPGQRAYRMS